MGLTVQRGGGASNVVLTSRTISVSGTGLSGGGDLSANRTITLTSSSDPGAVSSIMATNASSQFAAASGDTKLFLVAGDATHAAIVSVQSGREWQIKSTRSGAAPTSSLVIRDNSGGFDRVIIDTSGQLMIGPEFAGATLFGMSGANGQQFGINMLTELTTIAAAATTDTAIQIPAGANVLAASTRVTVAIPTAATYSVGISGVATLFATGVSVAVNTTNAGLITGSVVTTAQAIRVTPNLTPGTNVGRLRVTIWYMLSTPPTS